MCDHPISLCNFPIFAYHDARVLGDFLWDTFAGLFIT